MKASSWMVWLAVLGICCRVNAGQDVAGDARPGQPKQMAPQRLGEPGWPPTVPKLPEWLKKYLSSGGVFSPERLKEMAMELPEPSPPNAELICRIEQVILRLQAVRPEAPPAAPTYNGTGLESGDLAAWRQCAAENMRRLSDHVLLLKRQRRQLETLQRATQSLPSLIAKLQAMEGVMRRQLTWPGLRDALEQKLNFGGEDLDGDLPWPIGGTGAGTAPAESVAAFSFYAAWQSVAFVVSLTSGSIVPSGDSPCEKPGENPGACVAADGRGSGCANDPQAVLSPFFAVPRRRLPSASAALAQTEAFRAAVEFCAPVVAAARASYREAVASKWAQLAGYLKRQMAHLADESLRLDTERQWLEAEQSALGQLQRETQDQQVAVDALDASLRQLTSRLLAAERDLEAARAELRRWEASEAQARELYDAKLAVLHTVQLHCGGADYETCPDQNAKDRYLEARYQANQAIASTQTAWFAALQAVIAAQRTLLPAAKNLLALQQEATGGALALLAKSVALAAGKAELQRRQTDQARRRERYGQYWADQQKDLKAVREWLQEFGTARNDF